MRYYAGETVSDTVYVEDVNGDPSSLGADTVFAVAHFTTPLLVNSLAVTVSPGADPGVFVVSFDSDLNVPGLYTLYLEDSETGQVYLESYNVDPRAPLGAIRFKDFRVSVAIEMRDGMICTATESSGSSVFYDNDNLTDSLNAYQSSHAICVSAMNADNVGKTRVVRSSKQTDNSITFDRAFPAAFAEGDVIHLFNLGGMGFRPQVYDTAIQQCIYDAYPDALVPYSVDGSAVFDADAPRLAIPDDMVGIYGVAMLEETEKYRLIPSARPRAFDSWGKGYAIDMARRQIIIQGQAWHDELDGKAYRLYGYTAHRAPVNADDLITLDTRWLTGYVKAKIASRRPNSREWDSWAVEWGRIEGNERMRILTAREPNTVLFR